MNKKIQKQSKFYIFGKNVVSEQIRLNNLKIKKILVVKKTSDNKEIKNIIFKAKKESISVEYISQNEADNKSEKSNHQGILALVDKFKYQNYENWLLNKEESKTK